MAHILLPSAYFSFHFWLKWDFPKHKNFLVLFPSKWSLLKIKLGVQNCPTFLLLFSNWEEKTKHRKFQSILVLKYGLGHLWCIIITARRDIIVLDGKCNPFRNPRWWGEMRDLNHDKLMMSNDKTFWFVWAVQNILNSFFYFPKGTLHCFDTTNIFL